MDTNPEVFRVGDRVTGTVRFVDFVVGEDLDITHHSTMQQFEGRIVGFGYRYYGRTNSLGLKPGLYVAKSCPVIETDDGYRIRCDSRSLPSVHRLQKREATGSWFSRLVERFRRPRLPEREPMAAGVDYHLSDADDYSWRVAQWEKEAGSGAWAAAQEFVRDLPDTEFWEGDEVHFKTETFRGDFHATPPEIFIVTEIDYTCVELDNSLGISWNPPYYLTRPQDSGKLCDLAHVWELELVNRGAIWREAHLSSE